MYHPFDALFDLQRALESRLDSDWLRDATSGTGAFPPINVFQQGDNLVAILEAARCQQERPGHPGQGQHHPHLRQEGDRLSRRAQACIGASGCAESFDRTLTVPMQIDADGIKAEYRDGVLALFIPRAESDKPRSITIN